MEQDDSYWCEHGEAAEDCRHCRDERAKDDAYERWKERRREGLE